MGRDMQGEATEESASFDGLVNAHLGYARALARKIGRKLPRHVDPDELEGFALLGLTQAALAFDDSQGVAFTTFAYYRVRGAVFDGIRKMTWLPPAARKPPERAALADDLCEEGLGEVDLEASAEEIAQKFREATRSLGAVFLLSDAGDGESELEPADETSAAERAERAELTERVREAIATLELRQAEIIRMLYFEHLSMTEIAGRLDVHKATVSREHARAVTVLREGLTG